MPEGNPFLLPIDVENLDFHMLADLKHLTGMGKPGPRHVRDVQEAVNPVEIDERAEIGDILDRSTDPVADVYAAEEPLALLRALLLDNFPPAQDDVFALFVDLDDLEIVGVADESLQILGRNDIDLRRWQKGFDTDVHGEPAFYDRLDLSFDEPLAFEDRNDLLPVLSGRGLFLGQNHHAFVILKALEQDLDFVANLDVGGVFELARRDDPFALVPDVHEKFPRADFEDVSFDDAALAVIFDRVGDQFLQFCHNGHVVVVVLFLR